MGQKGHVTSLFHVPCTCEAAHVAELVMAEEVKTGRDPTSGLQMPGSPCMVSYQPVVQSQLLGVQPCSKLTPAQGGASLAFLPFRRPLPGSGKDGNAAHHHLSGAPLFYHVPLLSVTF